MESGLLEAATLGPLQFAALGLIAFAGAVVGGVSSFGAGLVVTPFLVPVVGVKGVVPLVLGLGLTGGALVGTDAVIGIVVNLVKAIMFGRLELLDHSLVLAGLLVGLCMVPGAYAARWLIDRMAMRIHTAIVESLVAFSGLSFLWSALT